ncbi:M48 family metallopeptidase [Lysobacter sp. GX 14042]|uniref:M48 family metallopeptidase n=1 Tax=Lysobacter sp. GX 14042 TaxID=2907155 RepID=UPI001F1C3F37|nr:M48 family metallopeptidase [Lysobacter sp. GX 14042]MCE7032346.1 M48 family metallopeptidase [Lysobacter sp. GX 14042]
MKRLLLACAVSLAVAACATTTSPTGRTQTVGAVSQQQLDQMGEQAFQEYRQQQPLSSNAAQTNYVRCVVGAVVRELPASAQTGWDVALFSNDSPNAFALPGGKVGVYTGIFKVARNQDQLAAVIAHEVGHVVSRHHDERITRQYGAQAGLGILGALVGSQYGTNAAQATQQLGGAALQTAFLLPNSRTQETEADVVGQRLMAEAGFDPREAVGLWQNMISAGGSQGPEWLSTHPNPQSRIAELGARATDLVPVYERARSAGKRPNCG